MKRQQLDSLAAWLILIGTLGFAIVSLAPPEPAGAPLASGYDPARAFSTLEELAVEPHPVGSRAHEAAFAKLVGWIRAAGHEPELQHGLVRGHELTNVVVRLPGSDSTGSVLMSAHYDTVPESPGAGDDGAGVVALLETLRVLVELPRRNDLVLLFTDGEELGLLGAHLYASGSARGERAEVGKPFAHREPLGLQPIDEPSVQPSGVDADSNAEPDAEPDADSDANTDIEADAEAQPDPLPGSRRSSVPLELLALPSDVPMPNAFGLRWAPVVLPTPEPVDRLAEVAGVLNFEAIGNGGPTLMFETGPGSAPLVELWGASASHPVGNCLAAVIYGWMPNDTDLSVYRDRGVPGLNFAIAGGSGHYHSPDDRPENIDRSSLAHMGDAAIGLARRLVDVDLGALFAPGPSTGATHPDLDVTAPRDLEQPAPSTQRLAFVALPPFGLLTWGGPWHLLLGFGALLTAAWVGRANLRPSAWPWVLLDGLGLAIHVGACAVLVAVLGLLLLGSPPPLSYDGVNLLLAGLVLGASLGIQAWARRRARSPRATGSLATAALLLWGALLGFFAVVELRSPASAGASYPFAVAVAALAAGLFLRLRLGAPAWLAALVLAPAIFVLGPILAHLTQLASRSVTSSVVLASLLLALGSLLLAPMLVAPPRTSEA